MHRISHFNNTIKGGPLGQNGFMELKPHQLIHKISKKFLFSEILIDSKDLADFRGLN
jgi:hypothetical protein